MKFRASRFFPLFGLWTLAFFSACTQGASAPVADINEGATITGLISVSPEVQSKVAPTDVLFVIARKDVGPPLAVKKIPNPSFPVAYALTAGDVMFPGTPFQGEVRVLARVDKDGGAGPAQPGDLEGTAVKVPARVGDRDVDVVINREVGATP
jgi:cytochrome c-type biogenesis protein CcmH